MRQPAALDPRADRIQRLALIVGAVALVLAVVGAFLDPTAFFQSYLMAFLYWLAFPLGAMGLVALYHLGGGEWGFPIRRPLEAAMITIPLLAVLFLPLAIDALIGPSHLYEWMHADVVASDPVLQLKQPFLNIPFWLGRAAIYFVLWSWGALLLYRMSAQQDRVDDPDLPRLLGRRGRLALFFFILAITFAAIDWGMSLDPHWFSTIYGVLFLIGFGLSGVAFAIIMLYLLMQRSPTKEVTSVQTVNDLGNLLLAFTVLWAYMNLSQFLIIWSGNLPEENPWYIRRSEGAWFWITLFLILFQFAAPFFVLLARSNKRNPRLLATLAGGVLFMRLVDMFWLVMPEVRHEGLIIHWLDIVLPVALGGIWVAAYIWALKRLPILPLRDQRDPRRRRAEHSHAPSGEAVPH
jgi:hypothetical protein